MSEEVPEITPELKVKLCKDQRDSFEVVFSPLRTYLVVAASHKDPTKNIVSKISCKKGIPIGGYVYDAQTDSYSISCVDYLQLGYVPFSMRTKVNGIDHWEIVVPLADNLIKKFLNNTQKKDLKNFKSIYKQEDYTVHFIQMVDVIGW